MIIINKENISSMLLMEQYSVLYNAKEKISLFEKKYGATIENFNSKITSEEEDFQAYDDYIEWKAYLKILDETTQKIIDIKNGNFKVA